MITLPWPDRILSPNSRSHWSQSAKAKKKARQDGHYAALIANYDKSTFVDYDGKLHLFIYFYAKTRNYPDADNCMSSCKAAIDGIADALGINDRRFVFHPFVKDETCKGGKIVITVTKGP
jgi:hypothetical protein